MVSSFVTDGVQNLVNFLSFPVGGLRKSEARQSVPASTLVSIALVIDALDFLTEINLLIRANCWQFAEDKSHGCNVGLLFDVLTLVVLPVVVPVLVFGKEFIVVFLLELNVGSIFFKGILGNGVVKSHDDAQHKGRFHAGVRLSHCVKSCWLVDIDGPSQELVVSSLFCVKGSGCQVFGHVGGHISEEVSQSGQGHPSHQVEIDVGSQEEGFVASCVSVSHLFRAVRAALSSLRVDQAKGEE